MWQPSGRFGRRGTCCVQWEMANISGASFTKILPAGAERPGSYWVKSKSNVSIWTCKAIYQNKNNDCIQWTRPSLSRHIIQPIPQPNDSKGVVLQTHSNCKTNFNIQFEWTVRIQLNWHEKHNFLDENHNKSKFIAYKILTTSILIDNFVPLERIKNEWIDSKQKLTLVTKQVSAFDLFSHHTFLRSQKRKVLALEKENGNNFKTKTTQTNFQGLNPICIYRV